MASLLLKERELSDWNFFGSWNCALTSFTSYDTIQEVELKEHPLIIYIAIFFVNYFLKTSTKFATVKNTIPESVMNGSWCRFTQYETTISMKHESNHLLNTHSISFEISHSTKLVKRT